MEIVINQFNSKYIETISLENLNNLDETFEKFSLIKVPLEVKIFSINESINSYQLSKLKNNFHNINIYSCRIYSNNRNTILAGKSTGARNRAPRIMDTFCSFTCQRPRLVIFLFRALRHSFMSSGLNPTSTMRSPIWSGPTRRLACCCSDRTSSSARLEKI